MNTTERFLIAMTIIFTVPWLIWRLGRTDYFAPLVVVQIITGILLGPGILGKAFPDYYAFVFTPAVIQSLNGIAWWAVMLFVMIAGVELDLRKAWEHRRESGITAGLALGAPLLFGCAAAVALLAFDGWMGPRALTWQFVAGHRHGLRGHRAAHPDPAHGEARHPAPAHRPAHPALRQPRRHRHLGRAGADPDGLGAGRQAARLPARLCRRRLCFPPADAAPRRARPLVCRADLAGRLRLRRRLGRAALHGRRLPRRRHHRGRLVRPGTHGPAPPPRAAGHDAGLLPQHRPAHQLEPRRRGRLPRRRAAAGRLGRRQAARRAHRRPHPELGAGRSRHHRLAACRPRR